jgi:DNA-binding response OmpR family regulator
LASRLESVGCSVQGPAGSIEAANSLLDGETPAAALLDLNLRGEKVTPIAKRLKKTGVPYAVVTGDGRQSLEDDAFNNVTVLKKPVKQSEIETALRGLLEVWPP